MEPYDEERCSVVVVPFQFFSLGRKSYIPRGVSAEVRALRYPSSMRGQGVDPPLHPQLYSYSKEELEPCPNLGA